jgi:magnesium-protoporphyrin IX monomethyl ester (oxidative) cyclase
MRFARALFVTPFSAGRFYGGVRPPVGIGYVEEFVAANGVKTDALDMTLGYGVRDLFRKIDAMRPDVIGFTVMTYQYQHTLSIIAAVKHRYPSISTVIGGAHVSAIKTEAMRQCPAADFGVHGEGEIPMRDLCLGVAFEEIAGLYYRVDGQVRTGPPSQYVPDLSILPFPRFESYELSRYTNEIEINTSRGCPFDCNFCAVSTITGRKIRYRTARSVGDEIAYFYKKGVRGFQFGDDNFLANRKRVMTLIDEIKERGYKNLVLRCGQGIRGELITREILVPMKEVGFRQLGVGVESASNPILETIRKDTSIEKIERGVKIACELGYEVTLLFVIGTPGETLADVQKSIDFAMKYPVMKAFFFSLIPFPGTELHDWVMEHNALLEPYDVMINRRDELKLRSKPFFATPEMPKADRYRAIRMTDKASRIIQVRTMQRKLARFGLAGRLAAHACQFNTLERLFVRHRNFRRVLDYIMFTPRADEPQSSPSETIQLPSAPASDCATSAASADRLFQILPTNGGN